MKTMMTTTTTNKRQQATKKGNLKLKNSRYNLFFITFCFPKKQPYKHLVSNVNDVAPMDFPSFSKTRQPGRCVLRIGRSVARNGEGESRQDSGQSHPSPSRHRWRILRPLLLMIVGKQNKRAKRTLVNWWTMLSNNKQQSTKGHNQPLTIYNLNPPEADNIVNRQCVATHWMGLTRAPVSTLFDPNDLHKGFVGMVSHAVVAE